MSKSKIINARTTELAAFIKTGETLTAAKKIEFAKAWKLTPRMVENYEKEAKALIAHENNNIAGETEVIAISTLAAVSKLIAIANGEYEYEKMMYVHNEPKLIKCKPTIAEQMQAMKELKKYEELFIAIKKYHEETFEKMLKITQRGKRLEAAPRP